MLSRRHFVTGFCASAALALGLPHIARAKDDWFEEIDKQFESTFEETDALFDKAIKEGIASLESDLAPLWGSAPKLPESKVWIGYDQALNTRLSVDYDKGEIVVETRDFKTERAELVKRLQEALNADSQGLDTQDELRKRMVEKLRNKWHDQSETPKPPRKDWRQSRELARLAEDLDQARFEEDAAEDRHDDNRRPAPRLKRLSLPMRPDRDQLSADQLAPMVIQFADQYDIKPSLVFSIIKNESAFNPRARSPANAFGLMQLVPTSGGRDAYSFILGRPATPTPSDLYDPYFNIELGIAYLHLLQSRYFAAVQDDVARRHLMIAAYNTGPGNVASAFVASKNLPGAIKQINRLSADEVYRHLLAKLPYGETKTYLARVSNDLHRYRRHDQQA